MPDTFGGEWHRPGSGRGKDRQRGRSLNEVRVSAYNDNEPQTSYGGCLLVATICVTATTAVAAALRRCGR